ncbi:hypothetical protein RF11_03692 [Thelohanellus kitauei]|uniref:Uncharacterized protein n=1 Tax=Thelohanellus kitauei TaxID=669202 RepID=A0A0C2NBW1_THEKT|nr:hypothetical protein RF11_03692 [Thelohanellus kitauei]
MVKVIKCARQASMPGTICLYAGFYDLLSDCVRFSIDESEVKKLYDKHAHVRRYPRKAYYHAKIFRAISGLMANHTSFDEMRIKWEEVFRSIASHYHLPDHEYLQIYCYFNDLIQRCYRAAYDTRGLYEDVKSLVQERKAANSSMIEAAVNLAEADRDPFIFMWIKAYKDAREGLIGDIIPLLILSIESELPENDELSLAINKSALIVIEQIKLLYRDGFDLTYEGKNFVGDNLF